MCAEFEHNIRQKKKPKTLKNTQCGRHGGKKGMQGRTNSRLLVIFWLGQNKSENQNLYPGVFSKGF